MDKVSNKDLWDRTKQVQMEEILKRRRGWLGLTQSKQGGGGQKNTCRHDLDVDIQETLERSRSWPMPQESRASINKMG